MLNVDRGTLYLWRNQGKITMVKFDGQYYMTPETIQPILDQRFKSKKVHSWQDLIGDEPNELGAIKPGLPQKLRDILNGFES